MLERENIMVELWRRMANVEGVVYTARNPSKPPAVEDMPAIQLFELRDAVVDASARGGRPIYKRKLEVIAEIYVKADNDASATHELGLFLQAVRKAVFVDGESLHGVCSHIEETEMSRVLRPLVGGPIVGVGLAYVITYIENIQTLFT